MFIRSLRTRIMLLALFASLLLAAAGISFFFYLTGTQRTKTDAAQRHLARLATAMQQEFSGQLAHGVSLNSVSAPSDVALPAPPPAPVNPSTPRQPDALHELPGDSAAAAALATVTATVLRHEAEVEGGFYGKASDSLVGFVGPHGDAGPPVPPGPHPDAPLRERSLIMNLCRLAAAHASPQSRIIRGPHDAVLLVAAPVAEQGTLTGAAWVMQRLPGLEAGRNKQLLLGTAGFTGAAIVCALLTFFITTEVNSGVQTVLARLRSMEGSLAPHPERRRPQLREFEQVLTRVDALSDSLHHQIETQRALELEVRHRERLSALGQFAAGVAHELRNPLATIRLRAQMAQRTIDLSAVERHSAVVLTEVDRLNSMIERLLYFSRPIRLQLDRATTAELCAEAEERWRSRCEQQGVSLTLHLGEDAPVRCDRSAMQQVLDNLVDNALFAASSGAAEQPTILLATRVEAERALIVVSDNGGGLDREAATHALEPFFTSRETGTGLGLSISYEIMQAHNGDLQLRNGVAEGAVATISLPVDHISASEEA